MTAQLMKDAHGPLMAQVDVKIWWKKHNLYFPAIYIGAIPQLKISVGQTCFGQKKVQYPYMAKKKYVQQYPYRNTSIKKRKYSCREELLQKDMCNCRQEYLLL